MLRLKTQPRPYQIDVYEKSKDSPYYGLFLFPGAGKSKIILDTAAHLYAKEEIYLLAIIAPKGSYENWETEVVLHLNDDIKRNVVTWRAVKNKKIKEQLCGLLRPKFGIHSMDIYLCNVESLSTASSVGYLEKLLGAHGRHALLVIDESTKIASKHSFRSKAARQLGRLAKYKRILTGTPVADGVMELPVQISFLGPLQELLGTESWYSFRSRYCQLQTKSFGSRSFQTVVGVQRMDELLGKLKTFCSIISREQANPDLPPHVYQQYNVELTKEQKEAYKSMRNRLLVELAPGHRIAVNIVLAKIMKLRQITAGFIYDEYGGITHFPSKRIDGLLELITLNAGKIIIWSCFVPCINDICKALGNKYGQKSYVRYIGGIVDRGDLVDCFNTDNGCRFFVSNQAVGGYGLTLTAAETMIFYTNSYSYKTRIQAEGRSTAERRATQGVEAKSTLVIDLVSPGTIDSKLLAVLKGKDELHNIVMRGGANTAGLIGEVI